jgi:hypothetical protein
MPFSNRIYRLAATVAKVASRFSDITIVFHGQGDAFPRMVTVIYVPISSCVSPNGSILHPRSLNFLSINRFDCFRTADKEG